jgi:hypothetical protein
MLHGTGSHSGCSFLTYALRRVQGLPSCRRTSKQDANARSSKTATSFHSRNCEKCIRHGQIIVRVIYGLKITRTGGPIRNNCRFLTVVLIITSHAGQNDSFTRSLWLSSRSGYSCAHHIRTLYYLLIRLQPLTYVRVRPYCGPSLAPSGCSTDFSADNTT